MTTPDAPAGAETTGALAGGADAHAPAPRRGPLPLTVLGGFLGAGKTTLLNHWLRHADGTRLAVLVNDFGAVNIDAELIASVAGDVVALTNGCVCCQIGDDFAAALMRVLELRERFDAVVVEASGVSDPARIAGYGRAVPELDLDGVIVLVDASAFEAQAADPLLADTLQRQVASADLIVLNKVDVATASQRAAAHERLRHWVPATSLLETVRAELPLALLSRTGLPADAAVGRQRASDRTNAAVQDPSGGRHRSHAHDHAAHAPHDPDALFETWLCRPAHALSADALRAWLRAMPAGVLRLKGIVRTDADGWSELQFAGRRGSLRKAGSEPADGPAVVAIGLRGQLPRSALEAAFAASGPVR